MMQHRGDSWPFGPRLVIWLSAAFVIVVCVVRYVQAPSFWLDEALVALSLRDASPVELFGKLERGLYFPRIYLICIAGIREIFGYHIWSLRLLPAVSFISGTILWARLLSRRSASSLKLNLLAGALLIGSTFWLEQAIQVRHYSFEVMLALVPFLLGDDSFDESLAEGKRKARMVMLAIPCFLSYTIHNGPGSARSGVVLASWAAQELASQWTWSGRINRTRDAGGSQCLSD